MNYPDLTIFSIPKAFIGHEARLQINAIKSWKNLPNNPQIILCGNDEGVAEVCQQYGLEHIPDVRQNSYGTYYLNDCFRVVTERAKGDLICYVNGDIIFQNSICNAIDKCYRYFTNAGCSNYLLVGRRWDFDLREEQEFNYEYAMASGVLHPPWGSDYFIYPKTSYIDMPDYLIGRPFWDNWMFYYFRKRNFPIVDLTEFTLVFHQNHGYSHIKQGTGDRWYGPEAYANRDIFRKAAMPNFVMNLNDTTHKLNAKADIKRIVRIRSLKFYLYQNFSFNLFRWLLNFIIRSVSKIYLQFSLLLTVELASLLASFFILFWIIKQNTPALFILYLPFQFIVITQMLYQLKIVRLLKNEAYRTRQEIRKNLKADKIK